jgi:serine/threonine-protein kinase RsbW
MSSLAMGAVLQIGTAMADLASIHPWLDDAAGPGLPAPLLNAMHVALEEAVMNIAMHGYGQGEGLIALRYGVEDGAALLTLEDSAPPFNQAEAPPPPQAASLEKASIGGRGLKLLRHYCKDMGYEYVGGRNRLTLRFPLPRK